MVDKRNKQYRRKEIRILQLLKSVINKKQTKKCVMKKTGHTPMSIAESPNYPTIALISYASKVMLKTLQASLQWYEN